MTIIHPFRSIVEISAILKSKECWLGRWLAATYPRPASKPEQRSPKEASYVATLMDHPGQIYDSKCAILRFTGVVLMYSTKR
jgi:hypothetical protein